MSSPKMLVLKLALAVASLAVVVTATDLSIHWEPCDVYTNSALDQSQFGSVCKGVSGQPSNLKAVCAHLPMPLDHTAAAGGPNITMFVKRVYGPSSKGSKIWILNGGPGGSGVEMECLLPNLTAVTNGEYDIMIPDHRGTGRSSPLTCGNYSADPSPACLQRALSKYTPEYLSSFSTSNAARDVYAAMLATAGTGRTLLYGVSYGTYWSQRLLAIFPDAEIDRVVLDGVVAPDLTRFVEYDSDVDVVGQALLGECAQQSTTCRKALGAHPQYRLHLLRGLLAGGNLACASKLDVTLNLPYLSGSLGSLVPDPLNRLALAPAIHRLLRCNDADVTALNFFFRGRYSHPPAVPLNATLLDNDLLGLNIGLSELYEYANYPLTPQQVIDSELPLLLSSGVAVNFAHGQEQGWPAYTRSPLTYGNTSVPILMIQGLLDPQTEPDFAVWAAAHYTNIDLVELPGVVHASAFPSRTTPTWSSVPCGMLLTGSYLSSGVANTSCVDSLIPIDFDGSTAYGRRAALTLFNVSSLWGSE